MASILPNTDAGWFKVSQWIYTGALIVTVVATFFVNKFANKIAATTDLRVAEANETAALANERAETLARENLEIKEKTGVAHS